MTDRNVVLTEARLPECSGPDREGFPWCLPVVRRTRALAFDAPVTVWVGENGSGKSTLLESLALAADVPAAGSADLRVDASLAHLHAFADAWRLRWTARTRRGLFLRAEDYFGFVQRLRSDPRDLRAAARAAAASAGDHEGEGRRRAGPYLGPAMATEARYGGDLDERSHGESFLAFFRGRLTGPGLYLLDEPEAALSPLRQLALVNLVLEAVGRGAQFVIATHAPILMAMPRAAIWCLDADGLHPTDFDAIEGVRTMRAFLADPASFLRHL